MPKLLGDWGGILGLRVVITKDSDTGLEAVTIAVTDVKHICCLERKILRINSGFSYLENNPQIYCFYLIVRCNESRVQNEFM